MKLFYILTFSPNNINVNLNIIKHSKMFSLMHGRPQGGARGSRRSPLENQKKKLFEKKICTNKILTCKRIPSYVMRENFLTKGPHVMR